MNSGLLEDIARCGYELWRKNGSACPPPRGRVTVHHVAKSHIIGRSPAFSNTPTCHVGKGALPNHFLASVLRKFRPGIVGFYPKPHMTKAKPSSTPSTILFTSKSSRPRTTYIS